MKTSPRPFNDPRRTARPPAGAIRIDPHVVLVAGYAGSGKSEFSRKIAEILGWPVLDKDTTTHALVDALSYRLTGDPDDRYSETYLRFVRPLEYKALNDTVLENVRVGLSVVVTAPYLQELTDRLWIQKQRQSLAALNARLHIVWVDSDAVTMQQRIVRRGEGRDRWKLQHWPDYAATLRPETYRAVADDIIDNTTDTFHQLDAQAERFAAEFAVHSAARPK